MKKAVFPIGITECTSTLYVCQRPVPVIVDFPPSKPEVLANHQLRHLERPCMGWTGVVSLSFEKLRKVDIECWGADMWVMEDTVLYKYRRDLERDMIKLGVDAWKMGGFVDGGGQNWTVKKITVVAYRSKVLVLGTDIGTINVYYIQDYQDLSRLDLSKPTDGVVLDGPSAKYRKSSTKGPETDSVSTKRSSKLGPETNS